MAVSIEIAPSAWEGRAIRALHSVEMAKWPRKFSANAKGAKKPAANGEFLAIYENIYCTWIKFE
jgi:hypothetical protein